MKETQKQKKQIYKDLEKTYRGKLKTLFRSSSEKFNEFIGCSPAFLREHMKNLLKEGMYMENYGVAWVIDHIKPIRSFNLLNYHQVKKCFHYINLGPLFCKENGRKTDKMECGNSARKIIKDFSEEILLPADLPKRQIEEDIKNKQNKPKPYKYIMRKQEIIEYHKDTSTGLIKRISQDHDTETYKNKYNNYV